MDATMLTVVGTGLTVVGTGIAALVALWRVAGHRFDTLERHIDKRFEAVDQRWTERFEMAETMNRERFEMAEKASRERFDAMGGRWTERFEAMDVRWTERFEQNDAAHAAICESIRKLDERTRADAASLHQRFDTLGGRFDDVYRHLLGAAPKTDLPGPAAAG